MPTSVEATIADVLLTHLGTFPAQTPPVDIAYPGVAFQPTPGKTFLEASLLLNTPVNRATSDTSSTEFRGILQVTVASPAGVGMIGVIELAAKVVEHFERGTSLLGPGVTIKIEGRPGIASPQQATDRVRVPVSVNFSCFARASD